MNTDIEYFQWNELFETGLPSVDKEHRVLVDVINDFGNHLSENTIDQDFIQRSINGLAEYAHNHFDNEKQIMSEKRVDKRHVSRHLEQHSDFFRQVSTIMDPHNLVDINSCNALFQFLVHWLVYHILCQDTNMARQVRAIDKGIDPAEAYDLEEKSANKSTGPLVNALTGLFKLVSKRNQALNELNKSLEQRVAERTAELVATNETLERLSVTDHLTGLPNRRFAMAQLDLLFKEAVTKNLPFSCLVIDADGFKAVNDTFGHDAGDLVLQQLSQGLSDAV